MCVRERERENKRTGEYIHTASASNLPSHRSDIRIRATFPQMCIYIDECVFVCPCGQASRWMAKVEAAAFCRGIDGEEKRGGSAE